MRLLSFSSILLASATALAGGDDTLVCQGNIGAEPSVFTKFTLENGASVGLLFPTAKPDDAVDFTCEKVDDGTSLLWTCENDLTGASPMVVRIERTPHGDWASVYTGRWENRVLRATLDCRGVY